MDMLPCIYATFCGRLLWTTGLPRVKTQECLSWPGRQTFGPQLRYLACLCHPWCSPVILVRCQLMALCTLYGTGSLYMTATSFLCLYRESRSMSWSCCLAYVRLSGGGCCGPQGCHTINTLASLSQPGHRISCLVPSFTRCVSSKLLLCAFC